MRLPGLFGSGYSPIIAPVDHRVIALFRLSIIIAFATFANPISISKNFSQKP